MADMDRVRAVAQAAAETAGRIAMGHFRAPLDVIAKADESPVTVADRTAEVAIRAGITAAFPDHGFWGEQSGTAGRLDGPAWIVDPIDGTRSFITGNPLFGLLIGYLDAGVPELGLVAMPALGETFVGVRGQGATMNGLTIRCRRTARLSEALVYINEGERLFRADPALFGRLLGMGRTRRLAQDCYPHALVAAGLIDVTVDFGLEPYDFLPLVGLVEAAGGVIADWEGNPLTLHSDGRVVTAATPSLLEQTLAVLRG